MLSILSAPPIKFAKNGSNTVAFITTPVAAIHNVPITSAIIAPFLV